MALLRRETEDSPPAQAPAGYATPPARELKRERKALLNVREERLRDLGGLTLEMYKRDRFSAALVVERCAELVAIEARIQEIDALLEGNARFRREGGVICACGAPILMGARFCATCGRPAGEARAASLGAGE